jgi:hypothetical protein
MSSTLKQAEALVDLLEPEERVLLIQYIAPKLIQGTEKQTAGKDSDDAAWQAYRKIGREIAAIPRNVASATQLVSDMRR